MNLASRIEGLTKTAGVELLVSQATRDRAGPNYPWRALAPLPVKGVASLLSTFTPLPPAATDAASPAAAVATASPGAEVARTRTTPAASPASPPLAALIGTATLPPPFRTGSRRPGT